MSGSALAFLIGAWGIILVCCIITLTTLMKHDKNN
ncbi:hypothetical protein Q428_07475 [Fervidicella metallireducens AeB]|uniref:MetS family NSS transporter small subunit n=1 Tax=Fervidicella metallireducens AeB TaxID=1403537 RepID=A0A017RVU6_9CLOT|nr:hypothetical protein Q428_07475 [Fervidicella metallireducens AeB]